MDCAVDPAVKQQADALVTKYDPPQMTLHDWAAPPPR